MYRRNYRRAVSNTLSLELQDYIDTVTLDTPVKEYVENLEEGSIFYQVLDALEDQVQDEPSLLRGLNDLRRYDRWYMQETGAGEDWQDVVPYASYDNRLDWDISYEDEDLIDWLFVYENLEAPRVFYFYNKEVTWGDIFYLSHVGDMQDGDHYIGIEPLT